MACACPLQDLLDDVSSVSNTLGAPLAAIGGTTKVLARKVLQLSACAGPPPVTACTLRAASALTPMLGMQPCLHAMWQVQGATSGDSGPAEVLSQPVQPTRPVSEVAAGRAREVPVQAPDAGRSGDSEERSRLEPQAAQSEGADT